MKFKYIFSILLFATIIFAVGGMESPTNYEFIQQTISIEDPYMMDILDVARLDEDTVYILADIYFDETSEVPISGGDLLFYTEDINGKYYGLESYWTDLPPSYIKGSSSSNNPHRDYLTLKGKKFAKNELYTIEFEINAEPGMDIKVGWGTGSTIIIITETSFSDGSTAFNITFPPGGSSNASIGITIPKYSVIYNATFNLTGYAVSGTYPTNFTLDIGSDGNIDYSVEELGEDVPINTFSTGSSSINKTIYFINSSVISGSLKIPKVATVVSAYINITGENISDDGFLLWDGWDSYTSDSNLQVSWDRLPPGFDPILNYTYVKEGSKSFNMFRNVSTSQNIYGVRHYPGYNPKNNIENYTGIPEGEPLKGCSNLWIYTNDTWIGDSSVSMHIQFGSSQTGDDFAIKFYVTRGDLNNGLSWTKISRDLNSYNASDQVPGIEWSKIDPARIDIMLDWTTMPVGTYHHFTIFDDWRITHSCDGDDYPSNVNVSANGNQLFYHSGKQDTEEKSGDFASTLNTLLSTCSEDAEGYCYFPLNISTEQDGIVELSDIDIIYSTKTSFDITSLLTNLTQSCIPDTITGNCTFPLNATSVTKGIAEFYALAVNYSDTWLTDCSGSPNYQTLNYTIRDENTTNLLNADLNIDFTSVSPSDTSLSKNYTFNFTNINNTAICILPNWADYTIDAFHEYETTGYAQRYYQISNGIINNITQFLTLYLAPASEAGLITFIVYDETGHYAEGITIEISKYIVSTGSYEVITNILTDENGNAYTYLVPYDFYRYILKEDGVVKRIYPKSQLITSTVSLSLLPDTGMEILDYYGKIATTCPCDFNNATSTLTCIATDTSGLSATYHLNVEQKLPVGTTTICDNRTTGTTAIMYCVLPDTTTNNFYTYYFTAELDSKLPLCTGHIELLDSIPQGKEGMLATLIIYLICISAGLATGVPIIGIAFGDMALIMFYVLDWFRVDTGILIGIIAFSAIVAYVLRK